MTSKKAILEIRENLKRTRIEKLGSRLPQQEAYYNGKLAGLREAVRILKVEEG